MKIALGYMLRKLPIAEMVRTVADIGYEYIELSPRRLHAVLPTSSRR